MGSDLERELERASHLGYSRYFACTSAYLAQPCDLDIFFTLERREVAGDLKSTHTG